MTTTQAIVAREPVEAGRVNWKLEDVVVGEPGDGEVLVEMCASGLCHTDIVLSVMPFGYPKVVGHEGAGHVRAVGKGVTTVEVGDPVLLSFYSCGSCEQCQDSHPAYCASFAAENYFGRQGNLTIKSSGESAFAHFFGQSSFSRHSVVAESSIVNVKDIIRDESELSLFAPLGCGFQTGMGAVQNVACSTPDDIIVILGMGGVGMAALLTAKIRGCRGIVAVDLLDVRLKLAVELGATHSINTTATGSSLSESIREIFPNGPSILIYTTGLPALIEEGLRLLRPRGKLVLIGAPPPAASLPVNLAEHLNSGRSVMGCIEGDCIPAKDIPLMIKWYREGRFPIDRLVSYFPVHQFPQLLSPQSLGGVVKPVLLWDSPN